MGKIGSLPWEKWIAVGFIALMLSMLLITLLIFGAHLKASADAKSACLNAGYSEVKESEGHYYCIKIENGIEIIVPLTRREGVNN